MPVELPAPSLESRSQVEGIEIRKLDTRTSGASGPLTPAQGGLGLDLWAGMTADHVAGLLQNLPAELPSYVLRDLARRLLLSSAEAPSHLPRQASTDLLAVAPSEDGGERLERLRAEKLYAMGEIEGLNSLLKLYPERRDDARLRRLRVDGLLLAGQWQLACDPATNAMAKAPQEIYWQRVKIACHAVSGDETHAQLGLDILRESRVADEGFENLVNGLFGLGVEGEEPPFSALYLAMMERLGIAPSPAFRAAAPAGWDGLFAMVDSLPLEERTPLAERAVNNGALAPDRLGALYLQPIFDPIALDDPLAAANGDMESWKAHALIYQAAKRQVYPLLRTQLLTALIDRMESDGLRMSGLRLASTLADSIAPSPSLSWAAAHIARAYYLNGETGKAEAWRLNQQQTARIVTPLWPHLQVTTSGRANQAVLDAWALGLEPGERPRVAALVQSIIEAFHDPSLGLQPPGPRQRLQQAALAGRAGETLLLMLGEFGNRELQSLDVPALALAVGALNRVGYAREARALAIEALVANGI